MDQLTWQHTIQQCRTLLSFRITCWFDWRNPQLKWHKHQLQIKSDNLSTLQLLQFLTPWTSQIRTPGYWVSKSLIISELRDKSLEEKHALNILFTATHSFRSSPSGNMTASRKFPLPRVAAACFIKSYWCVPSGIFFFGLKVFVERPPLKKIVHCQWFDSSYV